GEGGRGGEGGGGGGGEEGGEEGDRRRRVDRPDQPPGREDNGDRDPAARPAIPRPVVSHRAGSNNSMRLPSGSSSWICLPPGPFPISFRKRRPAFFSISTRDCKSSTSRTIRFHPPGSCLRPSGIAREPELFGPLGQRVRLPFEMLANGAPAPNCCSTLKPTS